MFSLAVQDGKLLARPHIPMLAEDNVRKGFFEPEQLAAVLKRLPDELQPVITFSALTGWRIGSEVLTLEWRNVDFNAGEVRLDPGVTKNREARVFPFTAELRTLLKKQRAQHDRLKKGEHRPAGVFPDGRRRTRRTEGAQGDRESDESLEGGLPRGRLSRPHPARPPTQPRSARWCAAASLSAWR
jgi:integrase